VPGDVAARKVPDDSYQAVTHNPPLLRPSYEDLRMLAEMIDEAKRRVAAKKALEKVPPVGSGVRPAR